MEVESRQLRSIPNRLLDPVRAFVAWKARLEEEDADTSGSSPVFRAVNRHGGIATRPLSDESVRSILRAGAKRAELAHADRISGHSFRRALAVSLREKGADRMMIERAGGWAAGSKALDAYLDEVDG